MKTLEHAATALFIAAMTAMNVTAAAAHTPLIGHSTTSVFRHFSQTRFYDMLLLLFWLFGLVVIIITWATRLISIKRTKRWRWSVEIGLKPIKPTDLYRLSDRRATHERGAVVFVAVRLTPE